MYFTAGSWWTAAFKSAGAVAARAAVLARAAGAFVDLDVAELTRVARHAATHVVTVVVSVHTRPVVTVHRRTPVNLVLAPVSLVPYTRPTAVTFIRHKPPR